MPVPDDADVIVVGGGLAGLIAARDVRAAGLSALVLEASPRVGGRTFTARAPDGAAEDLGAEFVQPRVHPLLVRELSRYAIPLEACDGEGGGAPPADDARFDALLAALDADAARLPAGALWDPAIADLDVPFSELLAMRTASDAALAACVADPVFAFTGTSAAEISALYVLREARQFGGFAAMLAEKEARVAGGTQALALALARDLGDALRLDAPATRVAVEGTGVRVCYGRDGIAAARAVIVAAPFNVLHTIAFKPPLPESVRAESARGHVGRARKTYFDAAGGPAPGEGLHRLIFAGRSAARSCIITLPSDDDVPARAAQAHDWSADPWARGTWVAPRPGGQYESLEWLRAASGPITFASGDFAMRWSGWMEGAVFSGEAAAERVLAMLGARDETK